MRLKDLLIIVLLLTGFSISAQKAFEVQNSIEPMSLGQKPCYKIFIPEVTPKMIEKEWVDKIENRDLFDIFKKKSNLVHVNKVEDELVAKDVVIESISQDSLNFYNYILSTDSGTMLITFVQLGDDFLDKNKISEHLDKSTSHFLRQFALEVYKEVVRDELKETKSVFKHAKNKLESLEDDREKLIKKNKEIDVENAVNKKNIEINIETINKLEDKMIALETQLDTLDGSDLKYDFTKDKIKESEKQKKKLLRNNKSLKRDIKKKKLKKFKNETEIERIKLQIEEQQQVVNEKKVLVEQVETKLNAMPL